MAPFPKPLPRLSQSDLDDFSGEGNKEAVLLVCGLQSMSILLILDPKAVNVDLLKTVVSEEHCLTNCILYHVDGLLIEMYFHFFLVGHDIL